MHSLPRSRAPTPRRTPSQIGLNALADLSHEEFKQRYGLGLRRYPVRPDGAAANGAFRHGALDAAQLPASVDWREKGAVAEVKNQMSVRLTWV
jgi:KDEL-tailed cysteine endopeptidase